MQRHSSGSWRLRQQGQGVTEYLIIVALIVIAAIGVYSFFGQATRQKPAPQEAPAKGGTKDGTGDPAAAAKGAGDAQKAGSAK